MSLFTQEVIGKCEKCGTDVSLNTLRSHDCIEKAEKDMDKLPKVPSGKDAQERWPIRIRVFESAEGVIDITRWEDDDKEHEYLSIQEHLAILSQPPAAPRQTEKWRKVWIHHDAFRISGGWAPMASYCEYGDTEEYVPAHLLAESAAEIERLKNGEELMHTIWKNLRAEISSLEKQLSEQGLVVRQLGEQVTRLESELKIQDDANEILTRDITDLRAKGR